MAWIDVSTGVLMTQPLEALDVDAALADRPGELLVADTVLEKPAFGAGWAWAERLTPLPAVRLTRIGPQTFGGGVWRRSLDAFGDFGRAEIAAAGGGSLRAHAERQIAANFAARAFHGRCNHGD